VTSGGALFFYKAKKPYIWMGILLAAHEVDGLDKIIVNAQMCSSTATALQRQFPSLMAAMSI
jgi:hypothetical protein